MRGYNLKRLLVVAIVVPLLIIFLSCTQTAKQILEAKTKSNFKKVLGKWSCCERSDSGFSIMTYFSTRINFRSDYKVDVTTSVSQLPQINWTIIGDTILFNSENEFFTKKKYLMEFKDDTRPPELRIKEIGVDNTYLVLR